MKNIVLFDARVLGSDCILITVDKQTFQLVELINEINRLHLKLSSDWLAEEKEALNLKKKQLRHVSNIHNIEDLQGSKVDIHLSFIALINRYCEYLNPFFASTELSFPDEKAEINMRIKDPESRISKITHYILGKPEEGKVEIKKCLNDLLGFRIIIDDFTHTDENIESIKREHFPKGEVRIHNSCKGEYKATHVYFQNRNNKFFPWELQIWNLADSECNKISHSVHKQGYTKWPEIHRESKEFKEGENKL